jgi:23S rRNA pseudouridine1911/1915/1917 synthase
VNDPQAASFQFPVTQAHDGWRLDAFLAHCLDDTSRVRLRRAISRGEVQVDGANAKPAYRLKSSQIVSGTLQRDDRPGPQPENIPLDILFEDDHLAAINKPPGMVVHPSKGHWAGTLASALSFHFKQLSDVAGPTRPGIIHRLDRDTSGVILIAKTEQSHLNLAEQFAQRTVSKQYLAIVHPAPDRDSDRIEKAIGVHPYQREKMAIREGHSTSRAAESFYEVVQRLGKIGVLHVRPKTGRTHQIRVHLASVGSPVLCDKLYSGRSQITAEMLQQLAYGKAIKDSNPDASCQQVLLARQALHAECIRFLHPASQSEMEISAPLPADLQQVITALGS